MQRASWAAAACVVLAHALTPGGAWRDALLLLAGVGAAVSMLVACARIPVSARSGWLLLTGGVAVWVLGDLLSVLAGPAGQPVLVLAARVGYVSAYPLLTAGLLRAFPAAATHRGRWVLDAVQLVGGVALVAWLVMPDPERGSAWPGGPTALLEALRLCGDVVLLVVLVRPWVASTARVRALRPATAAVLMFLLTDVLHEGALRSAWPDQAHLLDSGWSVGCLLFAHAAWQVVRSRGATEQTHVEFGAAHLVLVALSSTVVPVTLVVASVRGGRVPIMEVCVVGGVMAAAMLVRFGQVIGDLRASNADLARAAVTDPLTGLANLAGVMRRIARGAESEASPTVPVLVVISLEGYEDVVEVLGHAQADDLLRVYAGRLRACAPVGSLAGRLSRHVFALVFGVADRAVAVSTAQAVLDRVGTTVRVGGVDLEHGGVAGLAIGSSRSTFAEMAATVDTALETARRSGERLVVGDEAGWGPVTGGDLMRDLPGAVAAGELVVHYQPVVGLAESHLAAEALVRWVHPVHGLLGPDLFVPAAERLGLIDLVTAFVLDDALSVCARLRTTFPDFVVGVNISAHDLDGSDLIGRVEAALAHHGLPPSALALEVTETMAMRDVPRAERTLRALATLGVHLAIDDYGVGYGSLDYLRRLPFTILKIDRAFVGPARQDPVCEAILRSSASLGRALGMYVIAEGAEDLTTVALLTEAGCDAVQGWAISRPVPAAALPDVLAGCASAAGTRTVR